MVQQFGAAEVRRQKDRGSRIEDRGSIIPPSIPSSGVRVVKDSTEKVSGSGTLSDHDTYGLIKPLNISGARG